ncbi:MAG: hypothetical protein JW881_16265 [Spirochaetales bacterium]|nr:hypothetical protein [Spirochaetales bacterium]
MKKKGRPESRFSEKRISFRQISLPRRQISLPRGQTSLPAITIDRIYSDTIRLSGHHGLSSGYYFPIE